MSMHQVYTHTQMKQEVQQWVAEFQKWQQGSRTRYSRPKLRVETPVEEQKHDDQMKLVLFCGSQVNLSYLMLARVLDLCAEVE